ncbi:D-arabitol-phosphate dehydrogenase [Geobacillus sp. BCO2]|nr:D-arabitol-phosphate dehydrogenase [Geobacillus sp. BCO2]
MKIKLVYGGICGSDLGVLKGKLPHANYPVRAGHELVGVIVEKGEQDATTSGHGSLCCRTRIAARATCAKKG